MADYDSARECEADARDFEEARLRCSACNAPIDEVPAAWLGAEGGVFCSLDCLADTEVLPSVLFADDPSELIDLARLARGE